MAEKTTWIKLDRNILQWRWYQDANTMRVFLHLLLTANIKPQGFMTDTIKRGQLATSIGHIAKTLGITYNQARTALEHLKETKEITTTTRPRYLVITVCNYDKYQDKPTQNPSKTQANHKQTTTIKEGKEEKNIPSVYIPTRADVASYVSEKALPGDPDEIFDYYEAVGWEINGKPIKDWKAVVRRWKSYGKPEQPVSKEDEDAELHRLLEIMENGGNIYDTTGS